MRRRQTHLELDEPDGVGGEQSFRLEGAIDGPGMAEMVRLLFTDNMIPKREP